MSVPQNVKLSLQSLSECKIQEISYDGRETFKKPLSLSESLTDLANRIDFLNVDDDAIHEEDQAIEDTSKSWDNVKRHLHQALIEVTVLSDVLTIAQNKPIATNTAKDGASENPDVHRYLMFDHAVREPEQHKPFFQMAAKKKALSAAAKILANGAKRLESAWSEASGQVDFHSELLKMRKRWRLRRVGEKIIGDLSFKTSGSDFGHNGAFEVVKKSPEDDVEDDPNETPPSLLKSPIKVIVSSDLRGQTSIFVSIVKMSNKSKLAVGESCSMTYFDLVQNSFSSINDPVWHRVLCNAQNVLFCREIFMLLTKEAIQYKSSGIVAPFVVVGDVVSTLIFSDIKLVVKLMHSKKVKQTAGVRDDQQFFSLKHAMLLLLQAYHSRRLNVSPPKPVAAVLGLKDTMRHAAVQAWSGAQLKTIYRQESESLAESLLKMAKHYVIQQRLAETIDSITHQFEDPDIHGHWSVVSTVYESSVRVIISNSGFEACYRSIIQFIVTPNEVKAVQKDGTVTHLSIDKTSLYNFFISFICTHQLISVQYLSRVIGWTLLQLSPYSSIGISSSIMSRGTLLVATSSGDRSISVICSIDVNGNLSYEVHVQFAKVPSKYDFGLKTRSVFASFESVKSPIVRSEWLQIDWINCQGKYFLEKMETILTCLIDCDCS